MIAGAARRVLDLGAIRVSAFELGAGPLVLLAHGFPDTPATWGRLAPKIAAAGFRVVALTLRGYEPQAQPRPADYSIAALAGDLHRAIEVLDGGPAHLVGHDWGASVAFAAAAGRPDLVRTLTALAVPHPAGFAAVVQKDADQQRRSWYVYFIQMRGIADALLGAGNSAMLAWLWRGWTPGWRDHGPEIATMRAAFRAPGVRAAALAYYREAFDTAHPRLAETAALLSAPIQAPTLGIAGERDGCVRADVFDASLPPALFPGGLTIAHLPQAGHFLHLEAPDAVAAHILEHIRRHSAS